MFWRWWKKHSLRCAGAAVNAQVFLEKNVSRGLCLFASWREGKVSEKGFLDDYAYYTAALMELYHATLNREYLEKAERFCQEAAMES